jgi:hypothetical protein
MSFWIRVTGTDESAGRLKALPGFSENGFVISWDNVKSLMVELCIEYGGVIIVSSI